MREETVSVVRILVGVYQHLYITVVGLCFEFGGISKSQLKADWVQSRYSLSCLARGIDVDSRLPAATGAQNLDFYSIAVLKDATPPCVS